MEDDKDEEDIDDILIGSKEESTISKQESQYVGSIFDDDMVEKYIDTDGKARWRCKWCDNSFVGWNATKAVCHVNKLVKTDIKPCKVRIDPDYAKRYESMLKETQRKRTRSKDSNEAIDRSIASHNNVTASTLDTRLSTASSISSKRSKLSNTTSDSSTKITSPSKFFVFFQSDRIDISYFVSDSLCIKANQEIVLAKNPKNNQKKDNKNFFQLSLIDEPNPSVESRLTMSIADMIHSLGLPFSLASDRKFRHVLQLARGAGSTYKPPDRNSVSGELLDLNYEQYLKKNINMLEKDVNDFGLTYLETVLQ